MHLLNWLTSTEIAFLALIVSLITLALKLWEYWAYRSHVSIPFMYTTELVLNTQKVVISICNLSPHPVSILNIQFVTTEKTIIDAKFGNYKFWGQGEYVKYTDMLPVTFGPYEAKNVIVEIDNPDIRTISKVVLIAGKHRIEIYPTNQKVLSADKLSLLR